MTKSTSQQGEQLSFDVVVIGSGLSGLHYCIQLLQHRPQTRIALISKTALDECNSRYAQGGIAAVHKIEDSIATHIEDTMIAGHDLCDANAVKAIVTEGPEIIRQLETYPMAFNKGNSGEYDLAQEGGHSHRRIFNCGDRTGLTIIQTLIKTIRQQPTITCFEYHTAINLIYHTGKQGVEVLGAYILDSLSGKIHTFLANAVILATGGAGKTYRYTSNPMVATGDGVAMAYRAGARVSNMEFYQFHPTLLYHPKINNFLISEAVRGEGALLKNADTGACFMEHYAPQLKELATRDIVSRAIFNEMEQSENRYVYLDTTHHTKAFLKKRFPQIYATLASIGIEMSQDFIPVVPAAHYQCGGIVANLHGQTDLKRLYAIGEVACTGLHGANRLASNSLLEAGVMAMKAASQSLVELDTPLTNHAHIPTWNSPSEINTRRASQIHAHWSSVRGEMMSYAGIIRTEAGLQDLLELIVKRAQIIETYYWKHYITRDLIELRNIILNAELIVRASLTRRESRGGHYREDYPQTNSLAQNSILSMTPCT